MLKYHGFALPTEVDEQGGVSLMSLKELQNRAADAERAEMHIPDAVARVADYLHDQRERFFPEGSPLSEEQRRIAARFFSPSAPCFRWNVGVEAHPAGEPTFL